MSTQPGQGHRGIAMTTLSERQLKRIRKREPFQDHDVAWLKQQARILAQMMFADLGMAMPPSRMRRTSWHFRYAVASCYLAVHWIQQGGIETADASVLANDVKDTTIATYGTYFDGVLSDDRKLQFVHRSTRQGLDRHFNIRVGV